MSASLLLTADTQNRQTSILLNVQSCHQGKYNKGTALAKKLSLH